jgi:hypothetical protein
MGNHFEGDSSRKRKKKEMDLVVLGCDDINLTKLFQDCVQLGFGISDIKSSSSAARKPIHCDAKRKTFISPLSQICDLVNVIVLIFNLSLKILHHQAGKD